MSRSKKGGAPRSTWSPLEPAVYPPGSVSAVELDKVGGRVLKSAAYTVIVTPITPGIGEAGPVHLSIKRNDRAAVRDWRHFQRIKNEVVGPDREAYEVYPAESRLVDEANQYHLWVLPEGVALPWGFDDRHVGSPEAAAEVDARQRPFDDDPDDLDAHLDATHLTLRTPANQEAQAS